MAWLDSCDEHRNEGGGDARALPQPRLGTARHLLPHGLREVFRGTAPAPPSSLCSSQGSSSAASAARKSLSSPRTWSGWIPEDRR
ncbi:hypothetical protein CN141_32685 [Sinorhizobium meliloti]|nr:hypothetical protein CN141_32685 [Sinorhizobium meliloti]